MDKQFAAARSFCYESLKAGVMPDLVLDVLDALTGRGITPRRASSPCPVSVRSSSP